MFSFVTLRRRKGVTRLDKIMCVSPAHLSHPGHATVVCFFSNTNQKCTEVDIFVLTGSLNILAKESLHFFFSGERKQN